jgi:hypothetical protein
LEGKSQRGWSLKTPAPRGWRTRRSSRLRGHLAPGKQDFVIPVHNPMFLSNHELIMVLIKLIFSSDLCSLLRIYQIAISQT